MNKEEANKILVEKLKHAAAIVRECVDLADVHGLEFNLGSMVGGHGKYIGTNSEETHEYDDKGWQASSICY